MARVFDVISCRWCVSIILSVLACACGRHPGAVQALPESAEAPPGEPPAGSSAPEAAVGHEAEPASEARSLDGDTEAVEKEPAEEVRDPKTHPICTDWKARRQVPIEEKQFCYKHRKPPQVAPEYQPAVDWVLGVAEHLAWWGGYANADKIGDLDLNEVLRVVPERGFRITYGDLNRVELCDRERLMKEVSKFEGLCFEWTVHAVSAGAHSLYRDTLAYVPEFHTSASLRVFEVKPDLFAMSFTGDAERLRLEEIRVNVSTWPGHGDPVRPLD